MREQADLFGGIAWSEYQSANSGRLPTNDMDLVEKVLSIAESDGYVLVGPGEKVYRRLPRREIEAAPAHQADAVHQLLDSGWLKRGGSHTFMCGGYEGPANSVLVPRATKQRACRWRNLKPLADSKHTRRKGA